MSFVFFCLFLLFPRQTYFSSLLFTLPAQQWKLIHFSCGCSSSVFVCIVQASAQIMILHSHASYRIKWWNSLNYYSTNGKFHFFAFFASNYLRSIETFSNYLLWNFIFLLNHLINLKILEYEIKTVSFFFQDGNAFVGPRNRFLSPNCNFAFNYFQQTKRSNRI